MFIGDVHSQHMGFFPCNVLHVRSDSFIWIIPSLKLQAVRFAARIRARLPKVLGWVAVHS